jgi:hypothetical protein
MTLRSFWRTEAPSHSKISFPSSFPPCGGGSGGSRKKWQGNFGVCARRSGGSGGGVEASDSNAYAEVSHHHARGAWQINRFAIAPRKRFAQRLECLHRNGLRPKITRIARARRAWVWGQNGVAKRRIGRVRARKSGRFCPCIRIFILASLI